jgi:hypothetical protein
LYKPLPLLCFAIFFLGLTARAFAEEPLSSNADPMNYKVISNTDLASAFHTKTKWRLIITQEPGDEENPDVGNLHFCFLQENKPICSDLNYNTFDGVNIIPPSEKLRWPLLVLTADEWSGGPGQPKGTMVWAYRPKPDKFDLIFSNQTSQSRNQETRIIVDGPLSGDIVVAIPTERAPWPYEITVYRLSQSAHYARILDYNTTTRFDDGNPLAVIDAEMPEIERRLHLWKPGDLLPAPLRMPPRCRTVELQKGIEWCR